MSPNFGTNIVYETWKLGYFEGNQSLVVFLEKQLFDIMEYMLNGWSWVELHLTFPWNDKIEIMVGAELCYTWQTNGDKY